MLLDNYDEFDLNYNLEKIPQYTLPDPLLLSNGNKIKSIEEWEVIQREKIISLFSDNLYGKIPGKFNNVEIIIKSVDKNFFNSLATKKEVQIKFNDKIFIDLLIFIPNNQPSPSPIFFGMNFFGNHTISNENITTVSKRLTMETDINYQKKNNLKKYLTKIRFDKKSILNADLQEDNMGYEGIVHGGERIYFEDNMVGRIQFNIYKKKLDLYEATAYIPIEFYSSKKNLNVAIHNSFAKAKIIDFDPEEVRGVASSRWPLEKILKKGYGIATFYYGDIDPDYDDGFQNGIHQFFYKKNQTHPESNEWGSISAWASGLSYCMDYFSKDMDIDSKKVAVFGLSRLGKAALWAAALDDRFALVISGNSGNGGATIWRRKIGETLYSMNRRYPHWLCKNSNKFNHKEEQLPFDQHALLSLIAPRPLLIASAATDPLSDPIGEFCGAKYASKIYEFLKVEGLGINNIPSDEKFINSRIGYYIRKGKHDITESDWNNFILFADKHLRNKS
tara:strand:+ start:11349 stop:12860 length:1512 start_codon:yes stop_codon:yes gene_type:complete